MNRGKKGRDYKRPWLPWPGELVPPRQSQGAEIKVLLVGPRRSKAAGDLSASRPSVHHRGLHRGVPLRRGTRGRSPK